MKMLLAWSAGIVMLSLGVSGCSSSSSADDPAAQLQGGYRATNDGSMREINFYDETHYSLWRHPCAAGQQPAPSATRCEERGTYALNAARTELSLTSTTTGQTASMPFRALDSRRSSTDKASSALGARGLSEADGGIALYREPVNLLAAFEAGSQQFKKGVYVAMGDSYAAGLGTRSYKDDCKRSDLAYAKLIADARGYELKHVACSSARVPDVQGQLGDLSNETTLVTISIGGNDAGFADVVEQCAKPWPTTCWGDIDKAETFIRDKLPGLLNGVYDSIRAAAPNAQVIVVGYPRIFSEKECGGAARISVEEQTRLNTTGNLLSEKISAAVGNRDKFIYVDPREPFNGHAVCGDEWVNGLSNPLEESYHPNDKGHRALADLVSAKL